MVGLDCAVVAELLSEKLKMAAGTDGGCAADDEDHDS